MVAPKVYLGAVAAVSALSARIRRTIKLRVMSGQAEPKAVRTEKVRQLLRDYPNQFPASSRSISSWLSANPTRKYASSSPVPEWRLIDSPENDSIDALDSGLVLLREQDPEGYRALRNIYLDPEAGDADWDFYRKKLTSFHPAMKAERRAVGFLVDYLAPYKLYVTFPDDPPKKRPQSYRKRFPEFVSHCQALEAEGTRTTRAMEKTASHFGVSLTTIKRAMGRKGQS